MVEVLANLFAIAIILLWAVPDPPQTHKRYSKKEFIEKLIERKTTK